MCNTSCVEYSPLVHQICEIVHCLHSFCCSEFFRHTYAQLRSFYLSTLDAAHMRKTIRFSLPAQLHCSRFGVGERGNEAKCIDCMCLLCIHLTPSPPPSLCHLQYMELIGHHRTHPSPPSPANPTM